MSRVGDEARHRQPTVEGYAAGLDEPLPAPYLYVQLLAGRRPRAGTAAGGNFAAGTLFADNLGPL